MKKNTLIFRKINLTLLFVPLSFFLLGNFDNLLGFGIAKPKTEAKSSRVTNHEETPTIQEDYFIVRNDFDFSKDVSEAWIEEPEDDLWTKEPTQNQWRNEPVQNLWSECNVAPQIVEKEDYRLKPGDAFLISIYGDEKTRRNVSVDPSGRVSYLYAESIPAAGKTIDELRMDLEENLKQYLRYVTLSITPLKFNAEYYTVMGQLKEPGKQPFIGRPTILTALGKAQGFPSIDYRDQMWDMCDLDKAFIAREGNYIPVDFARLVKDGDLSQNIFLEPGDFIYIPNRLIKQVFVLGEIGAPKAIDYFENLSLIEAMADVGDVTERASSRVVVLRGSLTNPMHFLVDYSRIVKGYYPDFKLESGDIIYVPPRKLYLLREVFRAAVGAFVSTLAYESGIEWFVRSTPAAEPYLEPGTLLPTTAIIPVPVSTTAVP